MKIEDKIGKFLNESNNFTKLIDEEYFYSKLKELGSKPLNDVYVNINDLKVVAKNYKSFTERNMNNLMNFSQYLVLINEFPPYATWTPLYSEHQDGNRFLYVGAQGTVERGRFRKTLTAIGFGNRFDFKNMRYSGSQRDRSAGYQIEEFN